MFYAVVALVVAVVFFIALWKHGWTDHALVLAALSLGLMSLSRWRRYDFTNPENTVELRARMEHDLKQTRRR
jgi:hypothetical protein